MKTIKKYYHYVLEEDHKTVTKDKKPLVLVEDVLNLIKSNKTKYQIIKEIEG